MLRKIALTLLVVMLAAGMAQAQMKSSADVVTAKAAVASVTGQAGQRVNFDINIDIAKKWHIYAHGDTNFIGVDLVPEEGFPLTDLKAEYPHGHAGEFFGEKVFMIEGKDVIKVSAMVPEGLPAGDHALNLGVTVQACDDKTCLQPMDLPVAVKLKVK